MKVKLISFALVLLMVLSIMPLTVSAAIIAPPIMCKSADSVTHQEHWGYCNFCNTYVCTMCYPDHLHTSSAVCKIHGFNYIYCSTCNAFLCPSEHNPHTIDPQHGYCRTHDLSYTYCIVCGAWHCPAELSNHAVAPQQIYCNKHTTLTPYVYCLTCSTYYCPICNGGYHTHSTGNITNYWCPTHRIYSTYCTVCKLYYCTSCNKGSHNHANSTVATCDAPTANIQNNSRVESGTKVTLSTETPGATIYYTTNKSLPNVYSAKYTGPITITKDMTIIAIAVKNGMVNSSTSSYKYTVRAKVSFTDISDYPGLSNTLSILLDKNVITDDQTFNPSDSFTFAELKTWLSKIGVNFNNVTGVDHIADDENLTYNDFVYVTYKALLKADYIKSPRGAGYTTLKKFTYSKDIINASFYKAGFVSFYENALFYDINFKPDSEATRLYLANAIAAVIVNNYL